MFVTFIGRLAGAAANGVIMFQTLELFPTESRNTAMGSCLTMAQLGPLLAPYIVDILVSSKIRSSIYLFNTLSYIY